MCERNAAIDKCKEKPEDKGRIENNILIGPEFPICTKLINVAQLMLEALRSKPDCIGQIDGITHKQSRYAEMSECSIKCALWLRKQGVKPQDIIGICIDNHMDAIIVLLGIMYLNAIVNTWDHELSPITARYLVSLTSPKIIFAIPSAAATIAKAAEELKVNVKIVIFDNLDGYVSLDEILKDHDDHEVSEFECTPISSPDDICLIVLSSGTTGMPKGTEITHFSMLNRLDSTKIADIKDQVCMFTPTIRWQYGVGLVFTAILAYATRIVVPDVTEDDCDDRAYCECIEKYQVTYVATDPYILIRLIKTDLFEKYRLPTVKMITVSGAIFAKHNQEELSKKLPHVFISNSYGSTDAAGPLTAQTKYSKPGSIGFVITNIRMKVADLETEIPLEANKVGELRVKSSFLMKGYHKDHEATKKAFDSDGWLCTGDLGYYDEAGELFINGRISEFINFRSTNILPAEIETVLTAHPSVLQAAVIGIPHETDEQHPMAIVSVIPGKTTTEQELISYVEENMPDFYRLRAGVKFLDEIPHTITGKVMKRKLQQMFAV